MQQCFQLNAKINIFSFVSGLRRNAENVGFVTEEIFNTLKRKCFYRRLRLADGKQKFGE